jgi:energy-coupling factor transporter ATP-binding protein EcfA2
LGKVTLVDQRELCCGIDNLLGSKMKIKKVWAKGLYGYLDFEVTTKDGLNILVGINGSGKTSVLNVINWLTSPQIASLATNLFNEIGVEFFTPPGRLSTKLWAVQNETGLDIHGSIGKKIYHPINVRFSRHPKILINDKAARQVAFQQYHALSPEKSEIELWTLIEKLNKPLTITLDRRITVRKNRTTSSDEADEEYLFHFGERGRQITIDPITQIEVLARDRHSVYKSELIKLNEKLKSNIVGSTFSSNKPKAKLLTIKRIDEIESKLLTQVNTWTSEAQDANSISLYFKKIRNIMKSIGDERHLKNKNPMFTNFLADDMQRISALSDAFENFENESGVISKPIRTYIETLNMFLSDTGKTLFFDEKTSELQFKTIGSFDTGRGIELMSSGEKQVLILLTLVAFPPDSASSFIIDEPEISLHPKWQSQLLPGITNLMGSDAQMIIATHSPELVGKFLDHCVGM